MNGLFNKVGYYLKAVSFKGQALYQSITAKKNGINLIGYFSNISGVAEVGRFFARQLKNGTIPFSIYDVGTEDSRNLDATSLQPYLSYFTRNPPFKRNILFVNADGLPHVEYRFPKIFMGRYNAAVFFWEFNDYFSFPRAFNLIDEAIAFTSFIKTALVKAAPPGVIVTKLRFPFVQNWSITEAPHDVKERFGFSDEEYVFFFNFDFLSIYERKNPEALLRAFDRAFVETDKVRLVLKTLNSGKKAEKFLKFQNVLKNAKLSQKITVINGDMERNELMNLINAADCYISLHRSEGLGLGMMEAMSMGKPVVATAFGGNTDFTLSDNSLLVPYTLVPVEEGSEPYKEGWLWAEPDVSVASSHMKKLYHDKSLGLQLGNKGRQYIEEAYSLDAFNKDVEKWMRKKKESAAHAQVETMSLESSGDQDGRQGF